MMDKNIILEDVIIVREMERIISEYSGVEEAAVLIDQLCAHKKEFIAFVQLDGSQIIEEEALFNYCRQKINESLSIEFCKLPKTPTGKVARHLLKPPGGK